MSSKYEQVFKSLVRVVQDYILTLPTVATTEFINWDAHVTTAVLPDKDLIGIAGLSMVNDEKVFDIIVSFGISTFSDPNLFRHVTLIGDLFDMIYPGATLDWLDEFGNKIGVMVVKDQPEVAPIEPTITRPLQFLSMNRVGTVTQ